MISGHFKGLVVFHRGLGYVAFGIFLCGSDDDILVDHEETMMILFVEGWHWIKWDFLLFLEGFGIERVVLSLVALVSISFCISISILLLIFRILIFSLGVLLYLWLYFNGSLIILFGSLVVSSIFLTTLISIFIILIILHVCVHLFFHLFYGRLHFFLTFLTIITIGICIGTRRSICILHGHVPILILLLLFLLDSILLSNSITLLLLLTYRLILNFVLTAITLIHILLFISIPPTLQIKNTILQPQILPGRLIMQPPQKFNMEPLPFLHFFLIGNNLYRSSSTTTAAHIHGGTDIGTNIFIFVECIKFLLGFMH
mmetsp:Transcript_16694/g.25060  ORF Transcript_16694/g.25060 Transcript_16694/m.25060 type:complete len:315 (+) Transcript_16694:1346-2290(+)